jgi:acetyltransferase-like isoleucine patch superfamily enzyme
MSLVESFVLGIQRVKRKLFTLILSSSFFSIGDGTIVVPPIRFENLAQISLGKNVLIMRDCWIQVISVNEKSRDPVISIGNNVIIGMGATISGIRRIVIEDFALFARNVYISDHGHEFHDIERPISLQGIRKIDDVKIGYGAWLGQNVVVLPGVSIGRNAVVGANSVVNSDIPDYCVAVGSPAKIVSRYDSELRCWVRTGQE